MFFIETYITVQLNYNFTHTWNPMQNTKRDLAWKYALWSVVNINSTENNPHEQHMLSAMVTSFATWFYVILVDKSSMSSQSLILACQDKCYIAIGP